jgi:hypothetical protein
MSATRFVGAMLALSAMASCGGRYEVGSHPDGTAGAAGSAGSTTSTATSAATGGAGGATTSGAGGSPESLVDTCVVQSMRSCQAMGCHTGNPVSAGLTLDNNVLLYDYRRLLDRPNVGTDGVTQLGDPTGCPPGAFKLIDSAQPTQSLLWLKPHAQEESFVTTVCGGKMPVIGTFRQADKQCMQNWILSVVAAGSAL